MPIPLPTCRAHPCDAPVRIAASGVLCLSLAAVAAPEPVSFDPDRRPTELARTIEVTLRFPDPVLPYTFRPAERLAPAAREEPRVAVSGRAWPFAVAAAADLMSTSWALARGGVERNPLLRSGRLDVVTVKLVQVPLLAKLSDALEARYPRLGRCIRYATLALHVALSVHNVRMGRAATGSASERGAPPRP